MRTIPQHELRNNIARVLREVEAGEAVRVTVDGRPVADLVPIVNVRRTYVPLAEVMQIITQVPLDPGFATDIAKLTGATIDEL